jgi:hypothetical protein
MRHHSGVLLLTNAYNGTKYCPFLLERIGIRDPVLNIRNISMFGYSCSSCPSAGCASASNAACKLAHIFTTLRLN